MSFAAGIGAGIAVGMVAGMETGRRDAYRSIAEYCESQGITARTQEGDSVPIDQVFTKSRRLWTEKTKRLRIALALGLGTLFVLGVAVYFLR